jgi:YebC/PmpR family DNA-binding regulatory protein
MSGHSKWSKIKHQKGADDIKRGNLFTKLTREIIISTRNGGSNPEGNFRLRLAVQKARDNNMPLENIERAIKKASGELGGSSLAEVTLEGYGPGGTAILVSALTDNRNRTIQEVRSAFTRHGGNLGESGGVSWIFESKGVITLKAQGLDADELALTAIDAGAEDVKVEKDYVEVYTKPEELETVRKVMEQKGLTVDTSEILNVPKTMVQIDDKTALQALKLLDRLEEIDGVQNVYSNADFSDAVVEQYQSQPA